MKNRPRYKYWNFCTNSSHSPSSYYNHNRMMAVRRRMMCRHIHSRHYMLDLDNIRFRSNSSLARSFPSSSLVTVRSWCIHHNHREDSMSVRLRSDMNYSNYSSKSRMDIVFRE